jgi:hypothetical protein
MLSASSCAAAVDIYVAADAIVRGPRASFWRGASHRRHIDGKKILSEACLAAKVINA